MVQSLYFGAKDARYGKGEGLVMKIIKRSGVEEEFHLSKIEAAIVKANDTVLENEWNYETAGVFRSS